MSQSWVADRYHVYLWILDVFIFRPDKFCSQVVVRGNVSGHRWSTYLLKQSMIESGYIYIVDGASFVLFKYFFRGRQIAFFWGPGPSAVRAERRSVEDSGSTHSAAAKFSQRWNLCCGVLPGFPRCCSARPSSAGTPSGMGRAFLRRAVQAGRAVSVWAVRGCGSACGKITFKPEIEDAYVNVFLTVCSQENW